MVRRFHFLLPALAVSEFLLPRPRMTRVEVELSAEPRAVVGFGRERTGVLKAKSRNGWIHLRRRLLWESPKRRLGRLSVHHPLGRPLNRQLVVSPISARFFRPPRYECDRLRFHSMVPLQTF